MYMRGVASKRSSLCVICVLIGINWWKEAVMWVLNTNQPWRFCESVRGKLELKWTHEGSLTRMGLGDRVGPSIGGGMFEGLLCDRWSSVSTASRVECWLEGDDRPLRHHR